ncbi:hypothetical protein BKG84_24275 [Mycobacteroides chelonae]|uniref:Uncharacterized protein n=1 Tax=Mycobacteroides chelonae TaxID=1774 RepID=A0A1S1M146_MYCCH|nr:hypothetical protein BKG85_09330 [Mycobacteroides chelonae]OHU76417.1 hypothetical protein BKG84_24275 [Mycobacteroides chelonae]
MRGRFIYHDEIAAGVVNVVGYSLDLTALTLPIQLFGSHRAWQCVHHGVTMLKSADVRFTTVEASHLGLVALSAGVNRHGQPSTTFWPSWTGASRSLASSVRIVRYPAGCQRRL